MISLHRLQLVLLAGPGKMQAEIDFGLPEGRDGRPKPPDEVKLGDAKAHCSHMQCFGYVYMSHSAEAAC